MRVCKNKITDIIRKHFGANPLRIPESRIKPMTMIEIKKGKLDYLGAFKYLVKGGLPAFPEEHQSTVANVSGTQTKKVNLKLGFNILGNFLKAFGVDPAVVSLSIKNARKISFSFDDVKRFYIDPLELGQILSQHQVVGDPENIFIEKIIQSKDRKLALITDTLVSNNFSFSTYKENDTEAGIKVPLISEYISDMKLDVAVSKIAENEIQFQGKTPLSFAFSCVEILLDETTGKFSRGDWIKNVKSLEGVPKIIKEEQALQTKLVIDDDSANPLLIEF